MDNFQELIQSQIPIVVDFYADWCGPCQSMAPMIKELAGQLNGKARIIKVNIDKNQNAARFYKIESVPTFIIFKDGKMLWRHSGTIEKSALEKQLSVYL